jgi:hypothetical protein
MRSDAVTPPHRVSKPKPAIQILVDSFKTKFLLTAGCSPNCRGGWLKIYNQGEVQIRIKPIVL